MLGIEVEVLGGEEIHRQGLDPGRWLLRVDRLAQLRSHLRQRCRTGQHYCRRNERRDARNDARSPPSIHGGLPRGTRRSHYTARTDDCSRAAGDCAQAVRAAQRICAFGASKLIVTARHADAPPEERERNDAEYAQRFGTAELRAAGRPRQHDRHHHRVVRLLHLRDRVGAGVRPPVLPDLLRGGRHARGVRLVRSRVRGAAGRRPGVRPLRRPDRAQDDARADVDDDGLGHLRDGVDADLRDHRRMGADPDGRAPLRAGPRGRRRVGRRGADGHGALGRQAARLLRQLRPDGQRRRRPDVHRHVPADAAAPRRTTSWRGAGACRS